jgi:hypothetical protein
VSVTRPPRPRRKRREQERTLLKVVKRTESLADKLPGGSPENPIEVTSASVVETRARAARCIQCDGEFDLRGDRASSTPRGVLRAIDVSCRQCHTPRTLWFRVTPTTAN